MKTAIYPGSFDPVTEGHIDIIRRAAKLFDKLYVAVMTNVDKKTMFTGEERTEMIRLSVAGFNNVEVVLRDGLLAGYAAAAGSEYLVKGLRTVSDFESEFQMSLINKKLNPGLETVFLPANENHLYLSSSAVRSVAISGGDITGFVPEVIREKVLARAAERNELGVYKNG